jgi:large subunit ribosomal protein L10
MAKLGREPKKRRGRAPKEAVVGEVTTLLEQGHGFILFNNKGLTVAQATDLRAKLREGKVAVRVVKNTLLKIALKNNGIDTSNGLNDLLKEETVVAIGLEDPVTPAKLLVEFAKGTDKLQIKGGYLDGKVLKAADVEELSKLPGREELLQRLLGSMMAPAQNFVYALNAAVSKPVYLLDALRRKKEEAA